MVVENTRTTTTHNLLKEKSPPIIAFGSSVSRVRSSLSTKNADWRSPPKSLSLSLPLFFVVVVSRSAFVPSKKRETKGVVFRYQKEARGRIFCNTGLYARERASSSSNHLDDDDDDDDDDS